MQQTKKVVQYVNKVGEKFYARKKVLPFILNPPQELAKHDWQNFFPNTELSSYIINWFNYFLHLLARLVIEMFVYISWVVSVIITDRLNL